MLTNHKPSRMASKEAQAAALIGGMGKSFPLQRAYVSRESGSEKLRNPSRANSSVKLATAKAIHGSRFSFLCVLCASALILLPGCVAAHKKGRTIHERFDYSLVQFPGAQAQAVLTCHEIWRDEWTGGGRAFLADPKASELVSLHTNQTALGGSSTLTIGAFESQVSTNGIRAAGDASSQIIQGVGSAAGQLINKSVTGNPLK